MKVVIEEANEWSFSVEQYNRIAQALATRYRETTGEEPESARFCVRQARALVVLLDGDGLVIAAFERRNITEFHALRDRDEVTQLLAIQ